MNRIKFRIFLAPCMFMLVLCWLNAGSAEVEEKTYSIKLVKTAETEEEIYEVDDKKVLTQKHVVKKGEYLWKVLKERKVLTKRNFVKVFSVLKKLNPSLQDLDLIHPGDQIIIPLKIVPIGGSEEDFSASKELVSLEELEKMDFENYTVKKADSIIKVVRERYEIPEKELYGKYLKFVQRMNPDIEDMDVIQPGQVIRLPIYSPEMVRKPIKEAQIEEPKAEKQGERIDNIMPVAQSLQSLFLDMGEEWIQSGDHFIPMKGGGQINLKANSFPLINLQNGRRIIVDLGNGLPEPMAKLIESSWGEYRVVKLSEEDSLKSALKKILEQCGYYEVLEKGEAIELEGQVSIRMAGDWIVAPFETRPANGPQYFVINLIDRPDQSTPYIIKEYVESVGVRVIDYPPGDDGTSEDPAQIQFIEGGPDTEALIEKLLDLTGYPYSRDLDIPVYQSEKADFKLVIKADFFLNIKGRDAIIDITGLAPEAVSFLKEHQLLYLSLVKEKSPLDVVGKSLKFLSTQSKPGPHAFLASSREAARNIRIDLAGIVFSDSKGKMIFATTSAIPGQIAAFLATKGYQILTLPSS